MKYADELIPNKVSMPVIRVKYVKERVWWNPFTWFGSRADSGRCGPFQDRLRWQDLVPIVNCGNQKVCMENATQNNVKWLEGGRTLGSGNITFINHGTFQRMANSGPSFKAEGCPATPTMITTLTGGLILTSTATVWIRSSSMKMTGRIADGGRVGGNM